MSENLSMVVETKNFMDGSDLYKSLRMFEKLQADFDKLWKMVYKLIAPVGQDVTLEFVPEHKTFQFKTTSDEFAGMHKDVHKAYNFHEVENGQGVAVLRKGTSWYMVLTKTKLLRNFTRLSEVTKQARAISFFNVVSVRNDADDVEKIDVSDSTAFHIYESITDEIFEKYMPLSMGDHYYFETSVLSEKARANTALFTQINSEKDD